jgi:hypothetical protein
MKLMATVLLDIIPMLAMFEQEMVSPIASPMIIY